MCLKTCSVCKQDKATSEFHKTKGNKSGILAFCKKCSNARNVQSNRAKSIKLGKKQRLYNLDAKALRAEGKKRCPRCRLVLELEHFYKSKNAIDGHDSYCVSCILEKRKVVPTEKSATYYLRRKNYLRNRHLLRRYNITLVQYDEMFMAQGGVCAICKGDDKGKTLAVDHDHRTGKVRALLCGRCNPAIGFLGESPGLARRVIDYLENHGTN